MTIFKNIKTDFGAVGDGVANDAPAFWGTGSTPGGFLNWALNNQGSDQIVLTVPAGTYLFNSQVTWTSGSSRPDLCYLFYGILDLVVSGYGATMKYGTATFQFGSFLG